MSEGVSEEILALTRATEEKARAEMRRAQAEETSAEETRRLRKVIERIVAVTEQLVELLPLLREMGKDQDMAVRLLELLLQHAYREVRKDGDAEEIERWADIVKEFARASGRTGDLRIGGVHVDAERDVEVGGDVVGDRKEQRGLEGLGKRGQ